MKIKTIYLFCIIALCVFTFNALQGEDPNTSIVDHDLPQIVKPIKYNKQYNLAGETIPNTTDAYERLDREMIKNAYWHSSSLMILKLSAKHFPTIETILREEGVPEDFKYLAVAESGLRNVTSPAKARGLWQFMKLAAREYNLEVNSEVDQRYHVEMATHAAAKYLKHLKNRFGSWTNAAAAYNMGMTAFSKARKEQKENSFYNMNISEETNRYIFRIIALKEILSHPEKFGFYLDEEDKYATDDNYNIVEIKESIPSIGDFAHEHGTTYRMIKKLNPWLRKGKLTVKKNIYHIKVPRS